MYCPMQMGSSLLGKLSAGTKSHLSHGGGGARIWRLSSAARLVWQGKWSKGHFVGEVTSSLRFFLLLHTTAHHISGDNCASGLMYERRRCNASFSSDSSISAFPLAPPTHPSYHHTLYLPKNTQSAKHHAQQQLCCAMCSCNQKVCKRASVISQFDNPIEWESKKCFTYKSNETLSFF